VVCDRLFWEGFAGRIIFPSRGFYGYSNAYTNFSFFIRLYNFLNNIFIGGLKTYALHTVQQSPFHYALHSAYTVHSIYLAFRMAAKMVSHPVSLVPQKIPVDEDTILPYFPNLVKAVPGEFNPMPFAMAHNIPFDELQARVALHIWPHSIK
jgi:hypothetical protein